MMKKLLLLPALSLIVTGLSAQITITSADVATAGTTIMQANDTMPTVEPGMAGANQMWNLKMLNNHKTDTLHFVNPDWTTYGSQFPSSNIAMETGANGGTMYASVSSSDFAVVGQYGNFGAGPMAVHLNPSQKVMVFPATYMTNFTDTSAFDVKTAYSGQPGIDSVWVKSTTVKMDTVDGYGTVVTPLDSTNALRVHEISNSIDSIWVQPTGGSWTFFQVNGSVTYSYIWWANGVGYPLAQIDSTSNGRSATWLMAQPTAGIQSIAGVKSSVNVYPNPATDEVNFNVQGDLKAGDIVIYNATGQKVETVPVNGNHVRLNVSDFASGLYFYNLIGKNNVSKATGKFNVTK